MEGHIDTWGYKLKTECLNIYIKYIKDIYVTIKDKIVTVNNNKANLIKFIVLHYLYFITR